MEQTETSAITPVRVLHSEAFLLRPFHQDDAPSLLVAIEETREQLHRWTGIGSKDKTLEEVKRRISKWSSDFADRTRLQYGLISLDGAVLGGCALERIEWDSRSFDMGYWLRSTAFGRGYATAAVRLLTLMAFRDLGARRVAIHADALNARSIKLATRLGFEHEALRLRERKNAFGEWQDTMVFARSGVRGL